MYIFIPTGYKTEYRVFVNNGIGTAWKETFQLIPYDTPSMPTMFRVLTSTIKSNEVTVAWNPGFNGGPQQTFHVMYKKKAEKSWMEKQINDTGASEVNFTISELSASTEYEAFMFSHNIIGSSRSTDNITFTTSQYQGSTASSSKAGMIAGSIVGGLIGLLFIFITAVALRKFELMCICKCVRKKESTGIALYEASAVSAINNGEYESLGNRNNIQRNQPDINSSGNDNELGTNAYDSLDTHQSCKHLYNELGHQPRTDRTRLYENAALNPDTGTAVYVNTTFEKA